MSDGKDDLDGLGAIRPARDEVSSYRRNVRTEAPRQSNFNGILVFVILLMAIMMGVGGFSLYEVQKKLEQSNILLARGQENINELDNRLAATGTDVSKTLQMMQSKIETNFSEIDKLWGVAYRQNKPAIKKNETAISKMRADVAARLDALEKVTADVSTRFSTLSKEVAETRQNLILDNEEMSTQVALVRGQMQDQSDLLENNRRQISILANQLKEAQDAIDVIDRYRMQINRELLDLKARVQEQTPIETTSP